MKKVIISEDLIIKESISDIGIVLPEEFENTPLINLRYDGTNFIDISTVSNFFICDEGHKHIINLTGTWQPLNVHYQRELICETGIWRGITNVEKLERYKQLKIRELKETLYKHITEENSCYFPEWKQVNYAARYAELVELKADNIPFTEKDTTDLAAIKTIIIWKNNLLEQRDTIREAILNSTTNAEVDAAMATLDLLPAPFNL